MLSQYLVNIIDRLYRPFIARIVSRDIFGYALCGGCNMLLDAMWYFIVYHYIVAQRFIDIGIVVISPHIASLIVVFPITFFTGFWLNRNVAFRVTRYSSLGQLSRYALSVVGSIALNYLCMKLFVEYFGIWPTPSKVLTTCVTAVYSFLAARYFTFADNKNDSMR
ncbi:MAG: GtrA family protein [Alistipes sp.]|nr:GtrA family protein [Alistipes sp.]